MQSQHQLKDWLATDFAHKWVETELRAIDATPEQSNPRCLQNGKLVLSRHSEPVEMSPDFLHHNSQLLASVEQIFAEADGQELGFQQFQDVVQACGLSLFFRTAFWNYLTEDWIDDGIPGRELRCVRLKRLSYGRFQAKWNELATRYQKDQVAIIYAILKGSHPLLKRLAGRSFEALVDDVIDFHPELAFLRDNKVFRNRYVETVIIRIFYTINRTPPPLEADVISGKARGLTFKDFAKSDLYDTIVNLPNIEINDERSYFSYKHYFVIYCKFYDLDLSERFFIDVPQLRRYEHGSINRIAIDRVVEGTGLPPAWRAADENGRFKLQSYSYGSCRPKNMTQDSGVDLTASQEPDDLDTSPARRLGILTYTDFVWLILSEEDRSSTTALEYWFRVLDLDEDGVVSLFELHQYWDMLEAQLHEETTTMLDFRDVICSALDITKRPELQSHCLTVESVMRDPRQSPVTVTLTDLKNSRVMACRFFDYFINWQKLLERESMNGNRLFREVDEVKQTYFQQLHFLPSLIQNTGGAQSRSSAFCPTRIPCDKRSSWSRWADHQYEQYILQEEMENERKRAEAAIREGVSRLHLKNNADQQPIQQQQSQHAQQRRSAAKSRELSPGSTESRSKFKRQRVVQGARRKFVNTSTVIVRRVGDREVMQELTIGTADATEEEDYFDLNDDDDDEVFSDESTPDSSDDDDDDIDEEAERRRTAQIFGDLGPRSDGSLWSDHSSDPVSESDDPAHAAPNSSCGTVVPSPPSDKLSLTTALFGEGAYPLGTAGQEHPSFKPRLLSTSPPRSPTRFRLDPVPEDVDEELAEQTLFTRDDTVVKSPSLLFAEDLRPSSVRLVSSDPHHDAFDVE